MDFIKVRTLPWWESARVRLRAVMDGSKTDTDRIIHYVMKNNLEIGGDLEAYYPTLRDRKLAEAIRNIVKAAMAEKEAWRNRNVFLFVCSQGRIRSRTAEVLALRGGLNARSCGTDADAIVPINDHLIRLADVVICMEEHHAATVREFMHAEDKEIHVLDVEDIYVPFEDALVAALVAALDGSLPNVARIIGNRTDPVLAAAKRETS